MFVKIFQVSAGEGMGKYSTFVELSTQKLFHFRACVISARKAKHLDVTTMFTYSHATGLSANQSARTVLVILKISNLNLLNFLSFPNFVHCLG